LSAILLRRIASAHFPLLSTLFFFTSFVSPAAVASDWSPRQFTIEQGTAVADGNEMSLVADATGIVAFTVPVNGQLLQKNPLLTLFVDGQLPQRVMVYWQTKNAESKLARVEIAPPVTGSTTYNFDDINGWEGSVEMLGLALQGAPHQRIKVHMVSLGSPTLSDKLKTYWYNWSVHRGWRTSDINFITGTSEFNQLPYPAPYFAGLAVVVLTLFGLIHLLRRRTRSFSWQVIGCIILFSWIISDTFWHARLWQQVSQTWTTFGGKTAWGKLLASEDASLVLLTHNARQQISKPDARVFIASSSDVSGMLSAYYMSPFNPYWHRGGPELPDGDVFEAGDYILMVPPSQINYDARAGIVRRPGETALKVRQEYSNDTGVLLKVN